jgi:hypothetical protein
MWLKFCSDDMFLLRANVFRSMTYSVNDSGILLLECLFTFIDVYSSESTLLCCAVGPLSYIHVCEQSWHALSTVCTKAYNRGYIKRDSITKIVLQQGSSVDT